MRRLALVPLVTGVLLFPSVASALGLGEIEMQSALNQRLDAEIPVRGVPDGESGGIIVTLASEEAFRQVGLQRPFALTRLRFEVSQHDDGSYFVHVSSREPIVEPFLSFLIEIDWPEGNLLREYTVLLDPPVFVSESAATGTAPETTRAAGGESMTAAAVPAEIEREAEPAGAPESAAAEAEPEPESAQAEPTAGPTAEAEPQAAVEPATPAGDFSDTPVFLQVEQEEEAAEAETRRAVETEPEAEPETATQAASATTRAYETGPEEYGPVERGETLWGIASRLKRADMTVQQMMLALLRYNPDAFVDDNINRLNEGYVLRIPDSEAVLSLSARQAVAQVREQNALWQEFRTAARGGGARAAVETAAADLDVDTTEDTGTGGATGLKIVGSAQGTGAGSDESASATTTGSEQTGEQLKLAREQLESARMEKDELESRVGELEQTVDKMQRLIEVREDQLARLQEQLRQAQQGGEIDESAMSGAGATATGAAAESESAESESAEAETGAGATTEATGGDESAATPEPPEDGSATTDDTAAEAATATQAASGTTDATGTDTQTTGAGEDAADSGDTAASAAAGETSDTTTTEAAAGAAVETEASGAESGVVTTRTRPGQPGWLDRLRSFWESIEGTVGGTVGGLLAGAGLGSLLANPLTLPIAGAAVVLLLLGGLLVARRRRAGGEAEETGPGDTVTLPGDEDEDDQFAAMMQTEAADDIALDEDANEPWDTADTRSLVDEEGDEDAASALMSEEFNLDDLDRDEQTITPAAGDADDDTIAEADVYLAYGLHQQAEDLLNLALQEQPDRLDYHAKMLEAVYGAGKTEEFVQRARAFHDRVDDSNNDLWLRAVAMGKEVAPDDPLFQQEVDETLKPAGSTATRPPGTDFELGGDDGDATDLDFTLGDDDSGGDIDETDDDEFARTVMLDSDSFETMEGDAGLAAPADRAEADTGLTGPDTAADDEGMDFDLGDFDLGGDDAGTPATAAAAGESAGDSDDDDFDIDLGALDLGDSEPGDDATAVSAPGEDEEETDAGGAGFADMDLDALELDDGDTAPAAATDTTGDDFEMDLGDLDVGDDEPGISLDSTGDEPGDADALDLGDFDAGDDEQAGTNAADEQTISFDGDDEVSLADLEGDLGGQQASDSGGDEDELDTMLDLARAYIDMGDAESARTALEEVAEAGSDKQRGEAQSLLESV